MKTITLTVEGMTCGGCVKSVTRVLEELSGVSQVEVSLEKHNAEITFDESKVNVAQLIEAIEDAGFDANE